jgi:hypothetical protein
VYGFHYVYGKRSVDLDKYKSIATSADSAHNFLLKIVPKVIKNDQRILIWLISTLIKPKVIYRINFSVEKKKTFEMNDRINNSTNVVEIINLNPGKEFCEDFSLAISKICSSSKFVDSVVVNRNAERNPLVSNLLKYSYLITYCLRLKEDNLNAIFITDSVDFSKILKKSISGKKIYSHLLKFKTITQLIINLPKFTYWYVKNKFDTRILPVNQTPDILINTYVQNQIKSNQFIDPYFPGITNDLAEVNLAYNYLISGYIWFPVKLALYGNNYIFPEFNYFSIKDFFNSFRSLLRGTYAFQENFCINKFELSYLWHFETNAHSNDLDLLQIGMRLSLFDRFSEVMPSVKAVVCEYEGMLNERVFAQGRNNAQNSFKVFSVQHNNYSSDLINLTPTQDDFARNFLPDEIFFMGSKYKDDFTASYPGFRGVGLVPAFRYRTIFKNICSAVNADTIVVACGIRLIENLEIIDWLKRNTRSIRSSILFLVHPSMQLVEKINLIEEIEANKYSVGDVNFLESLQSYNRFIISSSSSGIIALLSGKQVMRVRTSKCADINPLEDFKDYYHHAEDDKSARDFFENHTNLDLTHNSKILKQLSNSYFNQDVNDFKRTIINLSQNFTRRR